MKNFNYKKHFWLLGFVLIIFNSCHSQYKIWVGENNEQKIHNLAYGDHKKQKMDVFLPANYAINQPTVIIVHGGAWKRGRKEKMIMIQKFLFKNKIPSININYRLVNKKIIYKNQLEDIDSAIKKFNNYSNKTQLSIDNYIILGESAGAHLALLYGYSHPEIIKKIISLSGPTDFYSSEFLKTTYSRYALPTIENVVGKKFNRKNIPQEFLEASPIYKVKDVPTLLFQGDQDVLVNRKQGIILDSVLTEKNIEHRFIYMKNTGHVPRFFSKRKREQIILPAILQWIQQ
jgi:acetyl esterase/lipase